MAAARSILLHRLFLRSFEMELRMYFFGVVALVLVLGLGARVGQIAFNRLTLSLAHGDHGNEAVEMGPGPNASAVEPNTKQQNA